MASWNSVHLEILYNVLGWVAFFSWSISFYPQHSSYLIYNVSLFFSSVVQRQYREKFGFNEMIPVAANDVAFSMHAVLLTAFTLFQIAIYDRGNQKISRISIGIVTVAWAILNFRRKSTIGFSIGNILLDFLGGVTNYCQMAVQSIDQNSWVNFYGNIGKTMISLVSIFFDILFMVQHYVLYRAKKTTISSDPNAATLSVIYPSVLCKEEDTIQLIQERIGAIQCAGRTY
ncbi:hypothetical protein DH2020_037963 [Rehmannia glutinosa]|uniref:Cystinosin-like protein n=1 Tax=Rehmannia glutinosa TaxID=99300 RepID=A0ABR0V144_REHGL